MNIDRLTKACLLTIVFLLSILVVKPLFEVDSYAGKSIDYKVITFHESDNESELKKSWEGILKQYGKDGWEVVGLVWSNYAHIAILKR